MDFVHLTDVMREKAYSNPDTGFQTFNNNPDYCYKFEDSGLGFGYFYFENKSKEEQMTVTMKIDGRGDIKWAWPNEDEKNPTVVIPPGKYEVAHYNKYDGNSFFFSFNLMASFINVGTSEIQRLIKTSKKQPRLYKGQDVGCALYTSGSSHNQTWVYVNKSDKYYFKESITFQLNNAQIQGTDSNYWNIVIWPGETKRIDIDALNSGKPFTAKAIESLYTIEELHPNN